MKEVVLPLAEAKVRTYHFEAYPMSILEANGREYYEWLYSNYIQLNCHKDIKKSGDIFLAFYDNQAFKSPYLTKENTRWSTLTKLDVNIHEYIEHHINIGYYMYFKVDEFYTPERGSYQNRHFMHDILVYGYNSKKEYYVVGYNQDGLYVNSKLTYNQFENAYNNNYLIKENNEWADEICLLKYNNRCHYEFNILLVEKLLDNYLNSINEFEVYKRYDEPLRDTEYGIKVFDKVIEYLNYLQQGVQPFKEYGIDNRIFRIIYEHKLIMLDRMKYINENNIYLEDLIEKYSEVCELSRICHLLGTKYRVLPKSKIIDRLKNYIVSIKDKDKEILGELLVRLRKNKK